ncbi:putative reverse transcriptase domain-containing protein [Tanacetum coccineum]
MVIIPYIKRGIFECDWEEESKAIPALISFELLWEDNLNHEEILGKREGLQHGIYKLGWGGFRRVDEMILALGVGVVLQGEEYWMDANMHVPLEEIKVQKTLHFVEEPVEIIDREVKSLRRSRISIAKVCWNSKRGYEDFMKTKFFARLSEGIGICFASEVANGKKEEVDRIFRGYRLELGDSILPNRLDTIRDKKVLCERRQDINDTKANEPTLSVIPIIRDFEDDFRITSDYTTTTSKVSYRIVPERYRSKVAISTSAFGDARTVIATSRVARQGIYSSKSLTMGSASFDRSIVFEPTSMERASSKIDPSILLHQLKCIMMISQGPHSEHDMGIKSFTTKEDHENHLRMMLDCNRKEKAVCEIAKPLTSLTQKNQKYEWGKKQEKAFQTLKNNLCNAPILSLPDGVEDFVVYYDASNQRFGCVLM